MPIVRVHGLNARPSRGEADSSGKRLPTPQFGHERKNAPGRATRTRLESAKSGEIAEVPALRGPTLWQQSTSGAFPTPHSAFRIPHSAFS